MHRFFIAICLITFFVSSFPVYAEKDKSDSWTMNFQFENDLFAGTDRNYTNGIKINWISPDLTDALKSKDMPEWSRSLINGIPFMDDLGLERNISFSLGQKIFTPDDISRSDLILNDRPYAGWLYLGTGFHIKNEKRQDTLEFQAGVIGPAALGREAQNSVHDWRNIGLAQGWGNQLDNEPGFVLLLERKYRTWQSTGYEDSFGADLITHLGASVGNVYTNANTGAEFRFGWNIPTDFGSALIRPGGGTNVHSNPADFDFWDSNSYRIYFFIGGAGRVVIRDIFLDGNTFSDSHSVDKKYLVGDAVFGGSLMMGGFKISYTRLFRSKEFDQQNGGSGFGSFSMGFTF